MLRIKYMAIVVFNNIRRNIFFGKYIDPNFQPKNGQAKSQPEVTTTDTTSGQTRFIKPITNNMTHYAVQNISNSRAYFTHL